MQESEMEQQLSRLEDAVLMLQGCPYMLAARGPLLHACRQRAAPQARVRCHTSSCCPETKDVVVTVSGYSGHYFDPTCVFNT